MKAIVATKYGPPEVLEVKERAKPHPRKNQILIKVHATAVTTSDSRVRAFRFPLWNPMILVFRLILGIRKPRQPVLGMVLAGEVEAVGKSVTHFQPGDQVYGMTGPSFGCYAEYLCLSEKSCIAKKPQSISFVDAAASTYGGLFASYCLEKSGIKSGDKILIYGASGAIGTAAIQLAKNMGAEITGVCSTANLELVKSLGADATLDYTRDDISESRERYDLIFDAVGKDKTSPLKQQCAKHLAKGGKYISVDDGMLKSRKEALLHLNSLMEAGTFKPVIDRSYRLEDIVAAHRYVDQGHKKGNVLISV
ncbi:NAD(P)-dependent alcohol dehydrogenase [Flexibacterium corallicola]|uniref:NAD(P)-dependent alcohol dehydrogenase n=1 Tax=Flexibacterium corallicola TaxID=3037259 RepID=UPI00286F8017|nr:NAD(P)-dependent alcohol dehydrogenase [Pseudovibrio sp. M1P-2-3]